MTESTIATRQRNRKPFFVVMALFIAPLLLAFAVYYGSSWRPTGTTNKGDLIVPALPLPAVTLNKADGTATDATFLRGSWTLVYLGTGDCAAVCRSTLLDMRNARLLLGKDVPRVSRVFLYTGSCCSEDFAKQQPDLVSVGIDNPAGQSLLTVFPADNGVKAIAAGRVYIVDPLGNLMMSYAPGANPRAIYQDLKKLLNLSHIG
jgi:cytochrome oxidase Cu insertion factor (SCO1/SenC/PrrC family)